MALKICLADFPEPNGSCNAKVAQRRQALAQQCEEEKLIMNFNLMDLNVCAMSKLKDISVAFGSETSKWRGSQIAIQFKDGLSWREMEDAVRLRSMRISALMGFIGSLQDIEEEVAVETERSSYIVGFVNGLRHIVASEPSRSALPEVQLEACQARLPRRPISVFAAFGPPPAVMSGFPPWQQEGPIARAAWGRRS